MSRVADKKHRKREALMDSAYELFTDKGFTSTTIGDISRRAGVAKGTFYLYFRDKDDIRGALIRNRAGRLLTAACDSMDTHPEAVGADSDIADKFIFIIDYLIDCVSEDKALLTLIGKDLTLGVLLGNDRNLPDYMYDADIPENDRAFAPDGIYFVEYIRRLLMAEPVRLRNTKLLMFSIISMVNASCYDVIMYGEPVNIEEYKPYLYSCIRELVSASIIH